MIPAAPARLAALLCLGACAGLGMPGPKPTPSAEPMMFQPAPLAVVAGESGLAAGIPAAVQAFPDPDDQDAIRAARADSPPTLFPRQLPSKDRNGAGFADRVSIAPDGRRLLVGTQVGDEFGVQVVTVNSKQTERTLGRRGELAFVGWSGPRAALVGYRRGGAMHVERWGVDAGEATLLARGRDVRGVLVAAEDGVAVAQGSRSAFSCADGAALPTRYDDRLVVQAGPLDPEGRVVFRTIEGRGALVPYDCDRSAFAAPIYEGPAFEGALYDAGGGGYLGVWDEDGVRYLDRSLAYEMEEVAASFGGDVDVFPIEFAASPNTLLLYVVGDGVPGEYYVLDRYAGRLDLHVSPRR